MARPVFSTAMGKIFRDFRTAAGWSLHEASAVAKTRNLKLSHNLFWRLESGQVKHPSRALLRALSTLYAVQYETLAARVASTAYGAELNPSQRKVAIAHPIEAGKNAHAITEALLNIASIATKVTAELEQRPAQQNRAASGESPVRGRSPKPRRRPPTR